MPALNQPIHRSRSRFEPIQADGEDPRSQPERTGCRSGGPALNRRSAPPRDGFAPGHHTAIPATRLNSGGPDAASMARAIALAIAGSCRLISPP